MKQKMIASLLEMIRMTIHAYPKELLLETYDLFDDLVKKEKNVDVLSSAILVLGLISLFSGQLREMSEIEAASIISVALLFDEVDPLVSEAFNLLREKIESEKPSKTKFLQQIVADFWRLNSEHMMPKVEAALDQYRLLVETPYMA